MGGNLAKAPLVAVFYAALLWYVSAYLPQSTAYAEVMAEFTMPITGLLLLLAYAALVSVIFALVYSSVRKGGIVLTAMLALSSLGLQWGVPALRQLMLGEVSGVMTRSDILFGLLCGFGSTAIALVLMMLLYKTEPQPVPKPGARPVPEAKYKLGKLALLIRMLVLPVIYFVLYYLSWYFLLWRVDAVRDYYMAEEKLNFMGEFINILVNKGGEAAITLLVGLAYAAFCLPLLFRMQGKRLMYILAVVLLYLSGAALYLIPSPVMPAAVRMAHLVETGVLMVVYGGLSGFLLHTVFRKEEAPVAAAAPRQRTQQRPGTKQPQAASAAQRVAAAQAQTPKPAEAGK